MTVLNTPRGTLYIGATFKDEKEAHDNGYGYWFTHRDNDGKRIDIYSKTLSDCELAMVIFDAQ
jgi:hypothetical protein